MRPQLFLCVLFSSLQFKAYSQYGEVLPIQFDQFYQNYGLIHPAATAMESSFQLFSNYRAYTGVFQGINSSTVGANIRLTKQDSTNENFHALGLNVINYREGAYFNRGRIYLTYAYHNTLSSNWFLSAGLMGGIVNHTYKATDVYPGGSVIRPTSDIGLFLYKPNSTHIGLSVSQLIPSSLAPLERGLRIKPSIVFSIDHKVRLSPSIEYQAFLLGRLPVRRHSIDLDVGSFFIFDQKIYVGANYKPTSGLGLAAGFDSSFLRQNGFRFFLTYYGPFGLAGKLPLNVLELSFVFKKL